MIRGTIVINDWNLRRLYLFDPSSYLFIYYQKVVVVGCEKLLLVIFPGVTFYWVVHRSFSIVTIIMSDLVV